MYLISSSFPFATHFLPFQISYSRVRAFRFVLQFFFNPIPYSCFLFLAKLFSLFFTSILHSQVTFLPFIFLTHASISRGILYFNIKSFVIFYRKPPPFSLSSGYIYTAVDTSIYILRFLQTMSENGRLQCVVGDPFCCYVWSATYSSKGP